MYGKSVYTENKALKILQNMCLAKFNRKQKPLQLDRQSFQNQLFPKTGTFQRKKERKNTNLDSSGWKAQRIKFLSLILYHNKTDKS